MFPLFVFVNGPIRTLFLSCKCEESCCLPRTNVASKVGYPENNFLLKRPLLRAPFVVWCFCFPSIHRASSIPNASTGLPGLWTPLDILMGAGGRPTIKPLLRPYLGFGLPSLLPSPHHGPAHRGGSLSPLGASSACSPSAAQSQLRQNQGSLHFLFF